MERILLTGAGGRPGVAHARALKLGLPRVHLTGVDADPYRLQRAGVDERHLVPVPADSQFIPVLRSIILDTGASLLLCNGGAEVVAVSAAREELGCPVFLPEHATVLVCEDNTATLSALQAADVPTPRSLRVRGRDDLAQAFDEFGPEILLRAVSSSGASGTLPVSNLEKAVRWVELNRGWGRRFLAAERLGEETVGWESVWRNGRLIVAQACRRLALGQAAMSLTSGIAGASETVSDPAIDQLGMNAVRAISPRPHGVMSVSIAYDMQGKARVTKMKAGRFMGGGVCHFAGADFNIPAVAAEIALGGRPDFSPPLLDPLRPGLVSVSGLDKEPVFTTRADLDRQRNALLSRMTRPSRPAVMSS